MNENNVKRPQVGKWDLIVTLADRFLTKLRPVTIVGTVLALCLVVYAIAWILKKR